ncbi:MAG TPA: PIN domain-containing protein [Candidatus Dormibacteraeota bacterium]|nr:PIN domain-containing protein [Candidatus Dormibacteraeota bacterium]
MTLPQAMVDTSVLVAYLNPDDVHHGDARRECLRVTDTSAVSISVITYTELMVGLLRGGHDPERFEAMLADLALTLYPVTQGIAFNAARLRAANRSLRLADSLIIATADVMGTGELLTADRAWPRITEKARLIQEPAGSPPA